MAYLNKQTVLKAYKELSEKHPDPTLQGATQDVSILRYFSALDRFYKLNDRPCNTRDKEDKAKFNNFVGEICSVTDSLYTKNFYYPLYENKGDYDTGSNFYSGSQVKVSLKNKIEYFVYPSGGRGAAPLFLVKNGELFRDETKYDNIDGYLTEARFKVAFVIWILRNQSISQGESVYDSLQTALVNNYTQKFVEVVFPDNDEVKNIIAEYDIALNDNLEKIVDSDVMNLFVNTNKVSVSKTFTKYRPYITAIKSKPFLLLAGISGTGKSRIVRELARACWSADSDEYKAQKPMNFEMVQVKPNWHDSSELIGYVSRISETPTYVAGDFLKFVAKAWENLDIPFFLCLDEMNLAPVEQYFAEYLSVVESRKADENGNITTDPILKKADKEDWYDHLVIELTDDEDVQNRFLEEGITLPQNLIVVGTVNMDETTFSFSRKVLDRAMTIEMNEVNLYGGLTERYEMIGKLGKSDLIANSVEGVDVYAANKDVCDIALKYLQSVNNVLEGTPFKIAYRTRNEFLLYVVNNLPYDKNSYGVGMGQKEVIARALDEITSMKILSRIEGDDTKVSNKLLNDLSSKIKDGLTDIFNEFDVDKSVAIIKINEMQKRLETGYTSFWS